MRALLSWSSGKDSAWSLHILRQQGVEVRALVTTRNEHFDRVAMHGVRRELVEAQAQAAGLPLWDVPLPWPCSNEHYEARMRLVVERAKAEGLEGVAFGDLFLAEIRAYRERQLAATGLKPLFPLWQRDTSHLASEMIAGGLRARLACVDPRQIPPSFAGRDFDAALLHDLPAGADPCGENGEFHTFVFDAPVFDRPLPLRSGEIVQRDGFVYADFELSSAD